MPACHADGRGFKSRLFRTSLGGITGESADNKSSEVGIITRNFIVDFSGEPSRGKKAIALNNML